MDVAITTTPGTGVRGSECAGWGVGGESTVAAVVVGAYSAHCEEPFLAVFPPASGDLYVPLRHWDGVASPNINVLCYVAFTGWRAVQCVFGS